MCYLSYKSNKGTAVRGPQSKHLRETFLNIFYNSKTNLRWCVTRQRCQAIDHTNDSNESRDNEHSCVEPQPSKIYPNLIAKIKPTAKKGTFIKKQKHAKKTTQHATMLQRSLSKTQFKHN